MEREPHTLEELTEKNILAIEKLEEAAKKEGSYSEKIATKITGLIGSVQSLWVHIFWFLGWISYNTLSPKHFDNFPFVLLTTIISMEAIFLSIFILISQNHDSKISTNRAKLNLQFSILNEQENTKMLFMLENIMKHLGAKDCDDPTIQVLKDSADPEVLNEQLNKIKEN